MTDPWSNSGIQTESAQNLEFEDNFTESSANSNQIESNSDLSNNSPRPQLPDSAAYLEGLERKLKNIKKGSKLVQALAEKREDCWRTLLQEDSTTANSSGENNNDIVDLDAPVGNVDSAVQELYRHLQPVQAVTVGETLHIVKFDHLEQQRQESSSSSPEEEIIDDKSTESNN